MEGQEITRALDITLRRRLSEIRELERSIEIQRGEKGRLTQERQRCDSAFTQVLATIRASTRDRVPGILVRHASNRYEMLFSTDTQYRTARALEHAHERTLEGMYEVRDRLILRKELCHEYLNDLHSIRERRNLTRDEEMQVEQVVARTISHIEECDEKDIGSASQGDGRKESCESSPPSPVFNVQLWDGWRDDASRRRDSRGMQVGDEDGETPSAPFRGRTHADLASQATIPTAEDGNPHLTVDYPVSAEHAVRIDVSSQDEGIQVTMRCDEPSISRALAAESSHLLRTLRVDGHRVNRVEVR